MSGHTNHNTTVHTKAEAHHHAPTSWDILVKSDLLNVLILAVALIYLGNKFLPGVVDQRKKQISKELEEAKKARLKAEEELETIKQKSKNAALEIEEMKEEAKKSSTTIRKQIEEETEKELEQLKQKVKREITSKYEEAVHDIKKSVGSTAIKLAEVALTQVSKNQEVPKKLISDFMSELNSLNKN